MVNSFITKHFCSKSNQFLFLFFRLAILSELLTEHKLSLQAEDFQPLLQLLHDFHQTVKYPIEIKILTNICTVLVCTEERFRTESNVLREGFCTELWYKIGQTAFRTSSHSEILTENIRLLRVLIVYKQSALPNTFMSTVLKTFLSDSIQKCNDVIRLLIAIFQHTNINTLENGRSLRTLTLRWLHKSDLKLKIREAESIELHLKSELSVLCLFTKINSEIAFKQRVCSMIEPDDITKYKQFIAQLKCDILFKSLDQLIVLKAKPTKLCTLIELPLPTELKSVINEEYFEELFEILGADTEIELTDNSHRDFTLVATSLAIYLHILNQLIAYESLDREKFQKSFLIKKTHFKMTQMEMTIKELERSEKIIGTQVLSVMDKLQDILCSDFYPVLKDAISGCDMRETIAWLHDKSKSDVCRDSRNITVHTSEHQLNIAHQVRYRAFMLLANLSAKNVNSDEAFAAIADNQFNFNSNTDLFIMHQLMKVGKILFNVQRTKFNSFD